MATEVARTSACRNKHGAVIAKSGRVLSISANTKRNDPAMFRPGRGAPHAVLGLNDDPNKNSKNFTFHAEVRAIKPLSNIVLEGATIYVARVFSTGLPGLSRPCDACYMEMVEKGIKKIVFTIG